MEKSSFETFIDENVSGDKIKILLKRIHKSLKALEEVWICRPPSKSLEYISKISRLFSIYGVKMFQKNVEGIDVIMGCYLYSQTINAKKIQSPRAFNDEQKAEFKKHIDALLKAWALLGQHFSYEKLAPTVFKNDADRTELESKLKEQINFI